MSITFSCAKCDKKFKVANDMIGKKGRCPKCGTMYVIPSESEIFSGEGGLQPLDDDPAPPPTREKETGPEMPEQDAAPVAPVPPRPTAPPKQSIFGFVWGGQELDQLKAAKDPRVTSDPYGPRRRKKRRQSQLLSLVIIFVLIAGAAAFVNRETIKSWFSTSHLKEELEELPDLIKKDKH